MDGQDFDLPVHSTRRIRWNTNVWEIPTFENAENFVHRLERAGEVASDPLVTAIVRGEVPNMSARSRQRRFHAVTGLSYATFLQIERARRAAVMLRAGRDILDTVAELRYFDQPHLTRALKRWLGMTPGEIVRGGHQLSFLYKTE
jgi:methylphosphotriester-DNA--protein-cysteine methyltransferase